MINYLSGNEPLKVQYGKFIITWLSPWLRWVYAGFAAHACQTAATVTWNRINRIYICDQQVRWSRQDGQYMKRSMPIYLTICKWRLNLVCCSALPHDIAWELTKSRWLTWKHEVRQPNQFLTLLHRLLPLQMIIWPIALWTCFTLSASFWDSIHKLWVGLYLIFPWIMTTY